MAAIFWTKLKCGWQGVTCSRICWSISASLLLTFLISLVLFGLTLRLFLGILRLRQAMALASDGSIRENLWGVGQVAAPFAWAPLLVELVYAVVYAIRKVPTSVEKWEEERGQSLTLRGRWHVADFPPVWSVISPDSLFAKRNYKNCVSDTPCTSAVVHSPLNPSRTEPNLLQFHKDLSPILTIHIAYVIMPRASILFGHPHALQEWVRISLTCSRRSEVTSGITSLYSIKKKQEWIQDMVLDPLTLTQKQSHRSNW